MEASDDLISNYGERVFPQWLMLLAIRVSASRDSTTIRRRSFRLTCIIELQTLSNSGRRDGSLATSVQPSNF